MSMSLLSTSEVSDSEVIGHSGGREGAVVHSVLYGRIRAW
jgi:hypothetical protein